MGREAGATWRRKQRLWQAQGGLCAYCFQPLVFSEDRLGYRRPPQRPTEDHVWPRSRYKGLDRNRVLVHAWPCNEEKGHRDPTGCELLALDWVWTRMEALFGARAFDNRP